MWHNRLPNCDSSHIRHTGYKLDTPREVVDDGRRGRYRSTMTDATQLVNPDNFIRAETDLYFSRVAGDGGFGHFMHNRDLTPLDHQIVVRQNRDTLYSAAVFDLDAGPATVTVPDAGDRFLSAQVISEDHYVPAVVYSPGPLTLTKEVVGTRYVIVAVRILVDPDDPADVTAVRALQDAFTVDQPAGSGTFEIPEWDPVSQKTVRDALVRLASTLPDTRGMFGTRDTTDPVRRLIGSASAWGGNPERDAFYLSVVPARNDGETPHVLTLADVPVDGFWSVTVYNSEGYFTPNAQNAYSLNNITATAAPGGEVEIRFGGCDTGTVNCLPITPGWNYMVRLYRPRPEVLDGTWTLPAAQPVG